MGTKHSMECSSKPTGSARWTKNSCPNANTGDPPSLPTFDIKGGHHDATTDYDRIFSWWRRSLRDHKGQRDRWVEIVCLAITELSR